LNSTTAKRCLMPPNEQGSQTPAMVHWHRLELRLMASGPTGLNVVGHAMGRSRCVTLTPGVQGWWEYKRMPDGAV
jgi:hypothetical protein